MRIIKTGLALALLLGVSAAYAAGLGKLTINSALGQPLNAEIDLVSVQPGELDALSARVATPEAFRDARIEYSSSLRLLRFSIEKRANGQPYLKVTSVAAINDPFLDLLVEVTWPAGRIQREYPILLDPPGYAQGRTAPPTVAAAPAPSQAAPTSPPASAPAASSSQPPAAAVTPSAPSASSSSGSGSPSAQAELGSSGSTGLVSDAGGDTYGPVEKGDTLRKIAEQVKPSSVSLEQMLVALYRENKGAFVNNNMNRLKTGQILKVPAAEEVEKLPRREVNQEIRTHVADWKAYREQLAGGVAATPAQSQSTNVASGRVGSAAVAPAPAPATSSQDVLKLSKTDAGGKAGTSGKGGAGGGGASQERLNALQEELTAKTKALGEANDRVAALEKQIRDMQRLLDLQKSAPATKTPDSKVATAPTPPKAEPPKPEPAKPAEPPKAATPEPAKVAPVPTPTPSEPAKTDTKLAEAPKSDATKPAETPKTDTKVAEAPKTPAPGTTTTPPKAAPKKAPPPKSWTDELMDNPALLAAGIGVPLLLGLGVFMFMRRRRQAEEMPSSMGSAFPADLKAPGNTGAGKPAAGLVDTGNSSFLTDFDKTGPGTIDTDEVDPVAEAEVYIAYGRDAQAEEILKEAMARDKGRHEIALKLLEIYHARKSATAFETVAKELRTAVGENHPMWQKAAAMGAQIDPTNPLYAAAAGGTATYTAMTPAAPAPAAKPDLDFDIEGSSGGGQQAAAPAPDFDLDLDSKKPDIETSSGSSSALDFDLAPSASTTQSPEPVKEEKPSFDFDLSGLDMGGSKAEAAPAASSSSSSMDLADLNLDSGGGGGGGEAVGTKLELAKAYLEIGDKDGAREILQEVAKEGSSAQQEEAKRLIASL